MVLMMVWLLLIESVRTERVMVKHWCGVWNGVKCECRERSKKNGFGSEEVKGNIGDCSNDIEPGGHRELEIAGAGRGSYLYICHA